MSPCAQAGVSEGRVELTFIDSRTSVAFSVQPDDLTDDAEPEVEGAEDMRVAWEGGMLDMDMTAVIEVRNSPVDGIVIGVQDAEGGKHVVPLGVAIQLMMAQQKAAAGSDEESEEEYEEDEEDFEEDQLI